MKKVLVDIIGSCVSRSVFLDGEPGEKGCADARIKIIHYFDKQNIVCCMSPPPFDDATVECITSAEQWDKSDQNLRNMKLTLNKKTMGLLLNSDAEYLFIDLYDFHTPMIGYNNTFFSTFKHEFFNLHIYNKNPDSFKAMFYFLDLPEWFWYAYIDLFFKEVTKKYTNNKMVLIRFCACNLYLSKKNEVLPIPENYKRPWMSNAKYNDKLRLLEEYIIKKYNPQVIDISKYFIGDENLYSDLQGSHFDINYYKDSFLHVKRILFDASLKNGYIGDFISCHSVKGILQKDVSKTDFVKMFSDIENPFNTGSVLDSYCKRLSVDAITENRFFLGEIYGVLHNNNVSWNDAISEEEEIGFILSANIQMEQNKFAAKFINQLRSRCANNGIPQIQNLTPADSRGELYRESFVGSAPNHGLNHEKEIVENLYKQAVSLHEMGRTDLAVKQFELILEIIDNNPEVHNDVGVLYFQDNNIGKALYHLKTAVKMDPDNTDYKMNMADIYMQTGKLDEAIGCYQEVFERKPDNIEASLALARLCSGAGLRDAALFYFGKVLKIEPDNGEARQYMAGNTSTDANMTSEGTADAP